MEQDLVLEPVIDGMVIIEVKDTTIGGQNSKFEIFFEIKDFEESQSEEEALED